MMLQTVEEIAQLLYQYVKVELKIENLSYSGYLKTCDPITKTVILCYPSEDRQSIRKSLIIHGNHIDNLVPSENETQLSPSDIETLIEKDYLERLADNNIHNCHYNSKPSPQVPERGEKLYQWLLENRLPVKFDYDTKNIHISDCIKIMAPYTRDSDYITPNRIVLKSVKKIVESLPQI